MAELDNIVKVFNAARHTVKNVSDFPVPQA
jgi:hypothetical protein